MAEAIVGDITPHCGVSNEDKHAMEAAAVQRIKEMLGGSTLAGAHACMHACTLESVGGGGGVGWGRAHDAWTTCACAADQGVCVRAHGTTRPLSTSSPARPVPAAEEIEALWREYEGAQSPEARLVKDFDKLEMILQAHEYEGAQPGLELQEFFDSTAGKWRTELGRSWAEEVYRRRREAAAAAAQQQQQQ